MVEYIMDDYLIDNFKKRVLKSNGCWKWLGDKTKAGYGLLSLRTKKRKRIYAHRLSYSLYKGNIPDGYVICHICDNPSCTNPDHLFCGTVKDNIADMCKKGRWNAGPPIGQKNPSAKLTENIVIDIRNKHLKGESIRSLAKKHKVARNTVKSIVTRVTWKHV